MIVRKNLDKASNVASRGGVKVHIFKPSNRQIWSVIGKDERWLNPDAEYCSCQGFYFSNIMHASPSCYHLDAVKIAVQTGNVDRIYFSDDEFYNFILDMISDMALM